MFAFSVPQNSRRNLEGPETVNISVLVKRSLTLLRLSVSSDEKEER